MSQQISYSTSIVIRSNGRLIEDEGISSDFVLQPTSSDVLGNGTKSTQYDRIVTFLRKKSLQTGKNKLYCEFL